VTLPPRSRAPKGSEDPLVIHGQDVLLYLRLQPDPCEFKGSVAPPDAPVERAVDGDTCTSRRHAPGAVSRPGSGSRVTSDGTCGAAHPSEDDFIPDPSWTRHWR
jgi:hypothetical protein